MTTLKYLKEKQKIWASIQGIELIGSKISRGERLYTKRIEDNLFAGKLSESTKNEYAIADGQEFGNGEFPGKMQALHSSSAIVVNVFEYWKSKTSDLMAKALKIPSQNIEEIVFEVKFPIVKDFIKHPNIDVVLHYKSGYITAIESKFTEPFGSYKKKGIDARYFNKVDWCTTPEMLKLAKKISPENDIFKLVDAAQLIKHMLGLLKNCSHKKNKFRLVYLYYDTFSADGNLHDEEIRMISEIFQKDDLNFQCRSYQELIIDMFNKNRNDEDKRYIRYLAERYL